MEMRWDKWGTAALIAVMVAGATVAANASALFTDHVWSASDTVASAITFFGTFFASMMAHDPAKWDRVERRQP